jgi:hypothetical protein
VIYHVEIKAVTGKTLIERLNPIELHSLFISLSICEVFIR